jgi:hypothetical protein
MNSVPERSGTSVSGVRRFAADCSVFIPRAVASPPTADSSFAAADHRAVNVHELDCADELVY